MEHDGRGTWLPRENIVSRMIHMVSPRIPWDTLLDTESERKGSGDVYERVSFLAGVSPVLMLIDGTVNTGLLKREA